MSENNILASIPRNAREEVHIQINEYKGKKYLDLRVYYTTDGGNSWNPSQKGVTISPEYLGDLKIAVEKAQQELCGAEEE